MNLTSKIILTLFVLSNHHYSDYNRPLVLNEIHMCGELDFVIVGGNIEYAGCNGTVCLQQFLVASLSG